MKKVLFSSILMLSVNLSFANSNQTEVSFANTNLKETTSCMTSHKMAQNKISNAEDDSLFCEGVGWAAGAVARKAGASKKTAKMIAIAAEAACEGWFD